MSFRLVNVSWRCVTFQLAFVQCFCSCLVVRIETPLMRYLVASSHCRPGMRSNHVVQVFGWGIWEAWLQHSTHSTALYWPHLPKICPHSGPCSNDIPGSMPVCWWTSSSMQGSNLTQVYFHHALKHSSIQFKCEIHVFFIEAIQVPNELNMLYLRTPCKYSMGRLCSKHVLFANRLIFQMRNACVAWNQHQILHVCFPTSVITI